MAWPYDDHQAFVPLVGPYALTGMNAAGGRSGQRPTKPAGATPMMV